MVKDISVSAISHGTLRRWLSELGRGLEFAILFFLCVLTFGPHVTVATTNKAAATPIPAILTHGPLVGAVTPSYARVFARTDRAAHVSIRYGHMADLSDAVTTTASLTHAKDDFTTIIPLRNLEPSTVYYLNVLVNGVPQKSAPLPTFKTFPPQDAVQNFRFVVLTDFENALETDFTPVPTFQNVLSENPDFVILGGDFDHSNPKTLEQKREMFKSLYSAHNAYVDFPSMVLQKFPLAHFWDDHDFGRNNTNRKYPKKKMSRRVMKEYFPTYPMGAGADYQSFSYAQADFLLLDSRSQRDPDTVPDGPNKSMLDGNHLGDKGELSWMLNHLKQSTATWKFVLTPEVFNPTHPKLDAWHGFEYERNTIVQFIHTNNIHGVIMLSGDSHFGGIDNGVNSTFPEMIVPPANTRGCLTASAYGSWSEGIYGAEHCPGYGVVQVTANPAQVMLQVKDDTGAVKLQYATSP